MGSSEKRHQRPQARHEHAGHSIHRGSINLIAAWNAGLLGHTFADETIKPIPHPCLLGQQPIFGIEF